MAVLAERRRVQPGVERARRLGREEPAKAVGEKRQRAREAFAREAVRLVLARCDEQLVREPARVWTQEHETVLLGDDARSLRSLLLEERAQGAAVEKRLPLSPWRRWLLLQPDELRMGVGQAGAGVAALVDERL